jgi:C-terminal processing protease CtpA/Prc
VRDIVTSIDGEPIDGLPRLAFLLFARSAGDRVTLGVLRGGDTLTVEVRVAERALDLERLAELVEPDKNRVARLGILGVDVRDTGADLASALRVPSGVKVVGHTSDEPGTSTWISRPETRSMASTEHL